MAEGDVWRKVRMTPELMETIFVRDQIGRRIRVLWGEPLADGFYVPTIRTEEDPFSRLMQAVIAIWEHTEKHTEWVNGVGYTSRSDKMTCHDPDEHAKLAFEEGLAWKNYREWKEALGLST